MRTIAIVNQKGGCGKTTTAINLAAIYASRGVRTLLVDMDPQSHCAAGLGVPEGNIEFAIGDALVAEHGAGFDPASLIWEVGRNFGLAPSTMRLATMEAPGGGLHERRDKDRRLASLLMLLSDRYELCLIDCPPTIGLLTFNALRAAREALVPVETGFFALRGAEKQWTTIRRMIQHIGRPIACHLLPSIHNPESKVATSILATLRRQFAGQILPLEIHEHEELREAASFGQPVLEYAPTSAATRDFERLADWLEDHPAVPNIHVEVVPLDHDARGMPGAPQRPGPPPRPPRVTPTPGVGDRAAELVRRVQDLNRRSSDLEEAVAGITEPLERPVPVVNVAPTGERAPIAATVQGLGAPSSVQQSAAQPSEQPSSVERPTVGLEPKPFVSPATANVTRPPGDVSLTEPPSLGVWTAGRLVRFAQPCRADQRLSIAGEFNGWCPDRTPLRFQPELGIAMTTLELPPGRYQYRIVIDGRWQTDSYNAERQHNTYGEHNSLLVVTDTREST